MVLLDLSLTYILLLLSATTVLFFILDNFSLSFLRGFTLVDSDKHRLVYELLMVASIVLGIYIVYLHYY